ncbi:class I SAM-dependent methyltransferase [Glaciihabitans sp. GrIS 2.15]|uniref:class I SAM-dependent methyltransferase n=1 Tax=Glaciihabitans sp. GrIS 2.15 TaxID=3071710 RepID=UPI002DFDF5EF|nr:ubiquinone/menaquinone biosynthesis C-methylase UbiE [Glaciihabitans sp. GrIS 2.15]
MSNSESWRAYFDSRLTYDEKRVVLWSALWDFALSKVMNDSASIVELGAGWCDFINSATSARRIAVDVWPGVVGAAAPGVEAHVGSALELGFLEDASIDAVFASNLVEHLTHEQCDVLVKEVYRILVPGGKLVLIQPNFRLSYKRYFDDFTHVSMWSEVSLADYLSSRGWQIDRAQARFMPFSIKNRLPVSRFLIRCYLASPLKPLAGQMLVVARKGTSE